LDTNYSKAIRCYVKNFKKTGSDWLQLLHQKFKQKSERVIMDKFLKYQLFNIFLHIL